MRIQLTQMWSRPGVNLAKGTVLDTEAPGGLFRCTSTEAAALVKRGHAVVLPEVEPEAAPETPEAAALAQAQAPPSRKRGQWKEVG